jgi:2-(1,2-epoxy-1,2-dihydrophenyl)acetyl-CoA isomerase
VAEGEERSMSSYETLLVDVADDVATVTLNRPDVLNAMSITMYRELNTALASLYASGVRALILTGAGRAFCSGADLKSRELDPKPGETGEPEEIQFDLAEPMFDLLRNAPVPTVCALNGAAAGAGASLALSCDFVISGQKGFFLQAYINLGLGPDMGSSWFLARSVGAARALELLALGDRLYGPKAAEWGLIHKAVGDATLVSEAQALAGKLAKGPTQGYMFVRDLLRAACVNDLETQIELERQYYFKAKATEDVREAQLAFEEGRLPQFKGR